MLHPDSAPPIPTLAFVEENATLLVSELSEGFIRPKKEAHFFWRRSQNGIGEPNLKSSESRSNPSSSSSSSASSVGILVGTRERMDQWLREYGPGSSCLWAQTEDSPQNARGKVLSSQLKLAYRLVSEEVFYVPVLHGTLLELSPQAAHTEGGGLRNPSSKRSVVKRPSFVSESPTMKSPSNATSNSTGDMSPSTEKTLVSEEKANLVAVVISDRAYNQLVVMVSPGGIIREYQALLRRSLESSNFLNIDFQLVDLPKWMRQHPFAAFMEGTDVVVVRRGDGSSSFRWALLRFDFSEGVVRSTKGEDLSDLEVNFRDKGIDQVLETRVGWWGQAVIASVDHLQGKHFERNAGQLEWKMWHLPVGNEDSCVGPLTQVVFDVLGNDSTLTDAESESLKSLFGTSQCEEPAQVPCHFAATPCNIPSIVSVQKLKAMSSKEQCALSHLRSVSEELKERGLCVLLNLLLGAASKSCPPVGAILSSGKTQSFGVSHSNPCTNYNGSLVRLLANQESTESSYRKQLNKKSRTGIDMNVETESWKVPESTPVQMEKERRLGPRQPKTCEAVGRLRETHTADLQTDRVSSHTERAVTAEEGHSCRFEEQSRGASLCKDDSETNLEVEPLGILVWLKSGFLEALLERVMVGSTLRQMKVECPERGRFLNVEVATEACLRLLEIVPKEGSFRLVNFLILSLKEVLEDFTRLILNPKQNVDCESSIEVGSHDRDTECNTQTAGEINHPSTRRQTKNLLEIFGKVMKFCKLLSGLTSNSPLIGGPLAESGGLDLVLDLYFCIVKRFPINLRLGALSSAKGAKNLEQILPGEAIKCQTAPLKVLPCILPSACIRRFAQACLMDHCMSPQKEKVDFTWPTAAEWTASYPCKQLLIDSHFNFSERSHIDEACDSPLEGCLGWIPDFNPTPKIPEQLALNKPHLPNPIACTSELKCGGPDSLDISSPSTENERSSCRPCSRESCIGLANSQGEGNSRSCLLTKGRPHVPRLPLKLLRSSNTRFGPSAAESGRLRVLPCTAAAPDLSEGPSVTDASPGEFEIFTAVYDVKFELLQTMSSLLSNRSHSLCTLRGKVFQRFHKDNEGHIVLQFLPDIIGGFLNLVPENTSRRTKKMLLKLMSLLDRSNISDGITQRESREGEASGASCHIGPVPPLSRDPKRIVDILLEEIGERLRILVSHLTSLCPEGEPPSDCRQTCSTSRALEDGHPLLRNGTISSGHLLSLWVDLGLLLRVLGDFVMLWPEEDSVQRVLNCCGRQVESVLGLLCDYSRKRNWSVAQILTMEHLLRLLTCCIKSVVLDKRSESQLWSEVDTFLWQLLFMNDLHWNCVKSFATWVVMKSCQRCLRTLFESYQKVLWEPLEIYYSMLGERINHKLLTENLSCTVHGVEISMTTIFPFLRVSILMMRKRLNCQNQSSPPSPNLYMGRLIFLLDFLMNPVEGLLMSVIRNPVPCSKLNKVQRDTEALNVLNFTNPPESISETQVTDSPEFTLPTSHATLDSKHSQCRKCVVAPCATTCAQKFTSCMEQESLGILAEVFALKAFDCNNERANLCVNPRARNPFLLRKYVTPFLEIIFFLFLKFYNKKVECFEPWLISPFSQHMSGRCKLTGNSGQEQSEHTLADGRSSGSETPCLRNAQDDSFCSVRSQDDVSSVACVTYGQVLRTLAQNQTEDVSQSFQHVRVMKFLVQQIYLEYELSQIATPRDVEISLGVVTAPCSLPDLQDSNCRDVGARVTKAGLHWSGERSKAGARQNKVEDLNLSNTTVDENVTIGDRMKEATFESFGNFTGPKGTNFPASRSRDSPSIVPKLQNSRASLENKQLNAIELRLGFSPQKPQFHRGFHSARDASPPAYRKIELGGRLCKQPSPNSQNLLLTCQKDAIVGEVGSKLTQPLRQRNDNTMVEKQSLSERGTPCTLAASLGKSGAAALSHRSSQEGDGYDSRPSIPGVKCQDEPLDKNHVTKSVGMSSGLSLPVMTYTGRFFDLNKEVERELAQEDFIESQDLSARSVGSKLAPFESVKARQGTSAQSSDSESSSELGSGISPKQNLSRPSIPRLNLSKSVRKGGPAISFDSSMDFELFPSTTSTLESKGRISSMLQKELQKEVVNSDRDSKSWGVGASYETERLRRRLYRHASLHVLLLELFVSLMLTPQGTLDTCYSDRYPMENCKLNAPFFLSYHLNHVANVHLLPCLSKRLKDFKPAAFRILKLTWRTLFNPRIYTNRVRIARGAFSQVYTAKVKRICGKSEDLTEEQVVLKIVDVPKGPHDPCRFFDVYSEVGILEKFLGEPAVCQILDYGVDTESFILVLKHYKCSLHTWRQGLGGNSMSETFSPTEIQRVGVVAKFGLERLPLYLEVYSAVLQAVKSLEIENVVHYDLKCDNILLEPVDSICPESEFWTPIWPPTDPSKPLPFRICIADFGQSKASSYLGGECTVRNRGTEYVKSPEMLKLLSSQSQRDSDFNLRNTDERVGKAVDVWSLGCLLYELLTGEYLFYDEDWLQFFMRVTLPSEELITKDKAEKLDNYGPVVDLLKFILVRDPHQRPSLDNIAICVEQLQLKVEEQGVANTSNVAEVPTSLQNLSEEDADSDQSFSEELVFSNEIEMAPQRVEHKLRPLKGFLECLRDLICHCQCGEAE